MSASFITTHSLCHPPDVDQLYLNLGIEAACSEDWGWRGANVTGFWLDTRFREKVVL